MKLEVIIPIIISLVSLLISIAVAYKAYFEPARLQMLAGRNLLLANSYVIDPQTQQPQWGGLSFILPFTFYNWSPVGNSIDEVRFVIGRDDNQTRNFDMIWTKLIKFSNGGSTLEVESIVYPIPIPGKSSIVKFIQFDWSPFRTEKIEIREGSYQLSLYAWTGNQKKPVLKAKIKFNLTHDHAALYQRYCAANLDTPIEISLGEGTRQANNLLNKQDIENEYG